MNGYVIFKTLSFALVLIISVSLSMRCNKIIDATANLLVSDSEEVVIGDNLYAEIVANKVDYPLIDTVNSLNFKLLGRYIDSIGRQLVENQTVRPENEHLQYTFSIVDNDTMVNAFAIPGGHIFIYTGLIKNARNEAEIAGVLAHELAHITQRHGIEQLIKLTSIEYIQALILGTNQSILTEAAKSLLFLKFSRNNEYEADSLAVEFLITGGYHPQGMKTFLEFLGSQSNWHFEPLATHPDTDKRIKAVADLILSKGSVIDILPTPNNMAVLNGWINGSHATVFLRILDYTSLSLACIWVTPYLING